jgi:ABC-type nitrate/sulfonate/bicarbonate transport system substrate-binding protein
MAECFFGLFFKQIFRVNPLNLFYFAALCLFSVFQSNSAFSSEPQPKLETVNRQLKWSHQFQFAGHYVAKQQGYYRDEGLDVHFYPLNQKKVVAQ